MQCKCGSNLIYKECCGVFHQGKRQPETALELMRSRYMAYVLGDGAYLVHTSASANRYQLNAAHIEDDAKKIQWLKLEIIDVSREDMVEFKAYYRENGSVQLLHEKSIFIKEEGQWVYDTGQIFETKIGRNASCSCGSGKKYKRCCGK